MELSWGGGRDHNAAAGGMLFCVAVLRKLYYRRSARHAETSLAEGRVDISPQHLLIKAQYSSAKRGSGGRLGRMPEHSLMKTCASELML